MCTSGSSLERDILVAQLTAIVGEWDKIIKSMNSEDEHESGHKHGMLVCRNHISRIIGVEELNL